MLYREVNRIGAISINHSVLDEMIADAFLHCEGKAWLANYKGAVSDVTIRLRNFDALAEKVVKMTDKGVFVRLYVMLKFGSSIAEVTAGIMDRLAFSMMEYLELPIDNIEVIVTGMLSKNVAKRNIRTDYRTLLNSRAGKT
ncbi:MAG: Asp23/Gls24 family envelope stress response protein [Eubacteriales bacterium]|nr:Asp23/Gls24 family envelope stress response protein [Eubacteriales bacterium]MDD3289616.1 Asp23/Gls24 family envelope stress response protein [Eubacteriales bacterium]MDD3864569.1 Asp23/Gls24 family envelope stress response protein [Eubacteriales bacterium]MDD4444681.1 Asp23/Gls24 family envelope stress response protein [Eubacteriales bacterium]